MAEPDLVADCVATMIDSCSIPVTVKHRIGIDDMDDYADMHRFVEKVSQAGCKTFIVHARKAWLKGLSPKENREVPPLKYDMVYQLKEAFPELNIVINGGITTTEQCKSLLEHVDGVMIGREAYNNPYFLADIDEQIFGAEPSATTRKDVFLQFIDYCEHQLTNGTRLHHMSRHILGLFLGQARARLFRRHITEHANKPSANTNILKEALSIVEGHKIEGH